ncbi:MAG TPA: hypothetical protein VII22_24530 [Streptosporangiaceae bacterium]
MRWRNASGVVPATTRDGLDIVRLAYNLPATPSQQCQRENSRATSSSVGRAGRTRRSCRDGSAYRFLDYQYAANVRLHEALCTVTNGGIDTGARQAADILAALPSGQHSHMITETGKTVLRAVPLEKRQLPAVREFREVLATTAQARLSVRVGARVTA